MMSDSQLLARFAQTRSEDAFAELVRRHVNLVYSAALRQVGGDAHLAQDVAQTVFSDLARKAPVLSRRASITGWLYTSSRFAAAKMTRGEQRRHEREERFMRESTAAASEPDWDKLRPVLDEAMHQLNEKDREAVLLRYFENRPFAEIGARSGLNENAARMRVERALEKLRGRLAKRGVVTTAALASVISANAVQGAPAALSAALTNASLAASVTGATGLWNIMNMAKMKLALGALLVIGASTAVTVQHKAQKRLLAENESLAQQVTQLKTEKENLASVAAREKESASLPREQLNELLRLRSEVGILRKQSNELVQLRIENPKLSSPEVMQVDSTSQLSAEDQFEVRRQHIINAETTLLRNLKNYAADHNGQYPESFDELAAYAGLRVTQLPLSPGGKIRFTSGKWLLVTPGLDGTLTLDDFEFLKAGVVDMRGRRVFLRNRTPLSRPSEDPAWIYGELDDKGRPSCIIIATDFTKSDASAAHALPATNQ